MEVIAYSINDVAAIVYPAPGLDVTEVAKNVVPDGSDFFIIDDSALPDRSVRHAWVILDGAVVIDADKTEILPDPQNPTETADATE